MIQPVVSRRYDIDWLRSLAFFVLILYHIGMFYVADWGWHVKSAQQSVWLQNIMLLTNPWRMSLLFFISAMAMSIVMLGNTFTGLSLAKLRTKRLLIPLLFGMLVIVPPQLYFELQQFYGYTADFGVFYNEYLNLNTQLAPDKQTPIGLITWNHLWFLPYLWCYSLLVLAMAPLLNRLNINLPTVRLTPSAALLILLLVSANFWWLLSQSYPSSHALLDDWYNHAKYFWVFLAGYMLPRLPHLWSNLIAHRRNMLVLAIASYLWLLLDRHGLLNVGPSLNALWWVQAIHSLLISINHWAWLLAVVAYAGRYLQSSNRFLDYANQAILAWYILHQTLIIVFAVYLSRLQLALWLEAILLIILTFLGCFLGYEIIKRSRWLRPLFGCKNRQG